MNCSLSQGIIARRRAGYNHVVRGNAMKFRRFIVPLLLIAAPLGADESAPIAPPTGTPPATALPATVPDAAQITERWRAYFQALQNLPSWSFAARMQVWEKDAKADAPRLFS